LEEDAVDIPKLYRDLADWWPLMSSPDDYEEEAELYRRALVASVRHPIRSVLELGSGGGNNASHLKRHFAMTLVEPMAGMLHVSQRLNPDCPHIQADMRTVRLDKRFDAVFVHDAVCYMTTERDVRAAIATAFVHCESGGVALFCPDHVRENFRPSTDSGGHDGGGRGLRYLEWTYDPDPSDITYVVDYAYLLRERDGSVEAIHDRHVEGLFARGDWLQWLSDAGFRPTIVPVEHSELEAGAYEMFVALKP
jgi:trans-aconitate methyltransferase